MCPSCGTLVGATASRCHQCGASVNFSLAAASRSLYGLFPSESPVTYFVLLLNGLMFAVSLMVTMRVKPGFNLMGGIDGGVLIRLGGRQAILILRGQLWRLVMPIFLHGSLIHIGMNSWVLMDIGRQVEEVYGSARYFFLYIATGILSFVVSTVWSIFAYGGMGVGIGASGALMGLIGLMLAITTRRGGAYMQMVRSQLIRWIVYIAVFGIFVGGVDNAAHFGGLAAGYLLGRVFADREPVSAQERQRAYALGWIAGIIVAVSFAFMLMYYFSTAGQPIG
jgi:rhomboid protease GluP